MRKCMLGRWRTWLALTGPILVFQQGCVVDPDLVLRAGLQVFNEVAVFALDNALVGLR